MHYTNMDEVKYPKVLLATMVLIMPIAALIALLMFIMAFAGSIPLGVFVGIFMTLQSCC